MEGQITVKYLQNYIQLKDYKPEAVRDYFLKLSEEVGELAEAIRKGNILSDKSNNIKGTIDEELWDVIYYVIAIANCYNIDLEKTIKLKEEINNEKYSTGVSLELNRE